MATAVGAGEAVGHWGPARQGAGAEAWAKFEGLKNELRGQASAGEVGQDD